MLCIRIFIWLLTTIVLIIVSQFFYSIRDLISFEIINNRSVCTVQSMKNETVINKTCNLNISVTIDLSNESQYIYTAYTLSIHVSHTLNGKRVIENE